MFSLLALLDRIHQLLEVRQLGLNLLDFDCFGVDLDPLELAASVGAEPLPVSPRHELLAAGLPLALLGGGFRGRD